MKDIYGSRAVRISAQTVLGMAVMGLVLTACSSSGGGSSPAADRPASTAPVPSAATPAASAPRTTGADRSTGGVEAGTASTPVPCGNADLRISWGYGDTGQPLQAEAVVFTNLGGQACTLQGYPGAAITDEGTVINATRVLNGVRGDLPPLNSPPLVTLAPGGIAYAVVEWLLQDGHPCYPTGTGVFEITAPNTTKTITLSHPTMGRQGICSNLEVNPVLPGTFGAPSGK